jgi:hypothetical protein
MSYLSEQEILCPFCQHPTTAEVWSSINVRENPELKDILLGGELNMVECEACQKISYAEHFLLYHDPDNELIVFVYPEDYRKDKENWREKTKNDFHVSQSNTSDDSKLDYEPITLFGLEELLSLVSREEEVSIQGEIVEALSRQHEIPVKILKPSVARRQNLPKILPYKTGSHLTEKESVIAALTELQRINDRLTVYLQTHQTLLDNPTAEYILH